MLGLGASAREHVIVSGGSRGLGQALVQALLDAGYRVSTFSRCSTAFTDFLEGNENFLFRAADIAERSAVAAFVREAHERFGRPFGLINCAGMAVEGVLATMSIDQLDRVLEVNLSGSLHLTRLVVRRMLLADLGGSIINISSIVGLRGYRGLAWYPRPQRRRSMA